MSKFYTISRNAKREVELRVDGKTIFPFESQKVYNHSPTGFEIGYSGSGPSQLALAIMLDLYGQTIALKHYVDFKWKFIAIADQDGCVINSDDIDLWLKETDNGS